MPQPQAVEAMQPSHALLVDDPSLVAEQHVKEVIPEARTGVREFAIRTRSAR